MYGEEFCKLPGEPSSNAFLSACNLAAATGDYGLLYQNEQVVVTRLMFIVTAAIVGETIAPVVTFYARPTIGSTASQVTLGTLTIPDLTAAGKVVYKNIESAKIPAGYTLAVAHTQCTSSGTAAGAGFVMVKGFVAVEDPRNNSLMILSA